MPTALIFGGSGKVARLLTSKLIASNYKVHSLIRSEKHVASLKELGAIPILQSVETATTEELTETIKSAGPPDVVIWSAGAGGGDVSRTYAVDRDGAIKSFDAVAAAGVKRYILVSAVDSRDYEDGPVPEWYNDDDKALSNKMWHPSGLGEYMKAKFAADKNLVTKNLTRGLLWTILRPGSLTIDAGEGVVEAGRVHIGVSITREDVAEVIMACIENDGTAGMSFDVVGGKTPIRQAVQQVVDTKADTFNGYY